MLSFGRSRLASPHASLLSFQTAGYIFYIKLLKSQAQICGKSQCLMSQYIFYNASKTISYAFGDRSFQLGVLLPSVSVIHGSMHFLPPHIPQLPVQVPKIFSCLSQCTLPSDFAPEESAIREIHVEDSLGNVHRQVFGVNARQKKFRSDSNWPGFRIT